MIGSAVYILPAVIFMVFGSGEVQKWNQIDDKDCEKDIETKL